MSKTDLMNLLERSLTENGVHANDRENMRESTPERVVMFAALQEAAAEYPCGGQKNFTFESRLPFPEDPDPINVMPAW